MAIFLVDLSPEDLAHRLDDALRVYVAAMQYPPGTEDQRAAMWLEHTHRPGWRAVAALEVGATDATNAADATDGRGPAAPTPAQLRDGTLCGVAYGYRGQPDQWWQQQVVSGMRWAGLPQPEITRLMASYFELTELHIQPTAQGRGLGEALTRRLLAGRPEARVLLSTPEISGEANRAWRLYRRLGFVDILRGHHFTGDPRPFAILGRELPL